MRTFISTLTVLVRTGLICRGSPHKYYNNQQSTKLWYIDFGFLRNIKGRGLIKLGDMEDDLETLKDDLKVLEDCLIKPGKMTS